MHTKQVAIEKYNWYYNIRDGEWSLKKYGSRKHLVKYHGLEVSYFERFCMSRSLDFLQTYFGASILVSQSKNLKSLGLADKNACLAVSQSL